MYIDCYSRFQLVAAKQVMDNLSARLQALLDSSSAPIREDLALVETEQELKHVCKIKFLRYELSKTIEIFEQLQAERNDVFYTMSTVRTTEPRWDNTNFKQTSLPPSLFLCVYSLQEKLVGTKSPGLRSRQSGFSEGQMLRQHESWCRRDHSFQRAAC